jgi:hypothetical protein
MTMDAFKILIANNHLSDFAGSELHCLELAEHLQSAGHDVTLAAAVIGHPWIGEADRLGLRVVQVSALEARKEWDIIWTHHVPIFTKIHARLRLRARRVLHGLLSSFLVMERPPLPEALSGTGRNVTFLANSEMTREAAIQRLPGAPRIDILRNLAPASWRQVVRRIHAPALRAVACVSNHIPAEIERLQALARTQGMVFDVFSAIGSARPRRISPDELAPYDAVVSIGKTVNYALAAGIPAFVYDRFGGPGWLTDANLAEAEATIFSGKCTWQRRSPEALLKEMEAGWPDAAAFARDRTDWAAERYAIPEQIKRLGLLDDLEERPLPLLPTLGVRMRVRCHARRTLSEREPALT